MTVQEQSSEIFGAIDDALARHPVFGDSTYILGQLQASLLRRLDKVASHLPAAGELRDAVVAASSGSLDHVLGDTVVRCAILHAHTHLDIDDPDDPVEKGSRYLLPLADCEEVIAATVRRLQEGKLGTTVDDGSLRRIGPEPYHGWLWTDAHSNDIFGRSFRYLLKRRYEALPDTPSDDETAVLMQGAQLLDELLPSSGPSALRHAHVIACVPSAGGWTGVASSSQFHLGGTIFLGHSLHSPWWVAEHLYHEALHQKFYDFRHAHLLLNLDVVREDAPMVCAPWNPPRLHKANQWDVHRVFAAFHVYVHVAFLALVAEERAAELEETYGRLQGMIERGKAYERAYYLGEQLREQCWGELGPAGQRLTEWLISVLEILNPSPPPRGAVVHLYLDRYEKEASQVAEAIRQTGPGPSRLARQLIPLAKDEIESARRVLAAIGADEELRRFETAVAAYSDDELGTKYPELRRTIGAALEDASADRYRLTESGDEDELLTQMIESASQLVYPFAAGYPPAVVDAKRRALDLRFAESCGDDVGRLLTVLAGAVPPEGRVLEIGTGVGVGTAWITGGLGERTDVEVITVEVDAGLSDAARAWPWPDYVQIVNADAVDALEMLGTFDLVFADAAPIKYGHLESVLSTLRPGGLVVVDDLDASRKTTEAQHAEKDALRSALLHHPELNVVEIAWSTGAIVALASRSMPADAVVSSGGTREETLART